MEFKLETNDAVNRRIIVLVDGEVLGEITWKEKDGIMHMDHTVVSPKLRGQGVAGKLLDEAADYARSNNLKMNAICSYVVSAFEKSDKYTDVQA